MTYKITVEYYGITRKFLVDADSKAEALEKVKKQKDTKVTAEPWSGRW